MEPFGHRKSSVAFWGSKELDLIYKNRRIMKGGE